MKLKPVAVLNLEIALAVLSEDNVVLMKKLNGVVLTILNAGKKLENARK